MRKFFFSSIKASFERPINNFFRWNELIGSSPKTSNKLVLYLDRINYDVSTFASLKRAYRSFDADLDNCHTFSLGPNPFLVNLPKFLALCQQFGSQIRRLKLSYCEFPTWEDFQSQVLEKMPLIELLDCFNVIFKNSDDDEVRLQTGQITLNHLKLLKVSDNTKTNLAMFIRRIAAPKLDKLVIKTRKFAVVNIGDTMNIFKTAKNLKSLQIDSHGPAAFFGSKLDPPFQLKKVSFAYGGYSPVIWAAAQSVFATAIRNFPRISVVSSANASGVAV